MSNVDQRYQEKLRARRENRTPVVMRAPDPSTIAGTTPEAVDARYRAKVAARVAGKGDEPKPADGKPEGKPEAPAKGEGKNAKKGEGKGDEPKPADGKPEGKPEAPAK
jgi:hypothetical protein